MDSPFAQPVPEHVVGRAQAGDAAAHEVLYATFAPRVFALGVRILGRRELAEDVLQETFVAVLRGLEGYRGECPVGQWIRQIALRRCLMHLRSPWHRRRLDGEPPERAACDEAGLGLDLDAALARLSVKARAVVWLHDVEGYTHREIAELMGGTASFSKSQLARAHQRMRELLDDDGRVAACTPILDNS